MNKKAILTTILGVIITVFGLIPFIYPYPNSNGPHSGPANTWDLLIIFSYDIKYWALIIGFLVLFVSFYVLMRKKD